MKLKQYLVEHGVSIQQFANRLGVTHEAVRLYTLGRRIPERDLMIKIAALTENLVQPNDFYFDHSDEKEPAA